MSIFEQLAAEPKDGFVDLTPMQRHLWSSQRRSPLSGHQNTALLSHIDGAVEPNRLADAFADVVAASDVLRSQIVETPDATLISLSSDRPRSEIHQMTREATQLWAAERVRKPLDMAIAGIDSAIIEHPDGTVSWYLNLHHVITDATASARVFELTAEAYANSVPILRSYYTWAASIGVGDRKFTRAIEHWGKRQPLPRIGRLYEPVSRPDPASSRRSVPFSSELRASLDAGLEGRFAGISQDFAWTNLLLTATALYLHRTTGAQEMALGLPVHNRSGDDAAAMLGPLMQVFPVDVSIKADDTFASLHKRVAKAAMSTLRNARPGTAPSSPDIEAVINVITRGGIHRFGDFDVTTQWVHPGATDPSHVIQVQLTTYAGGAPSLDVDVNAQVATSDQLDRLPGHFAQVLAAMVTDPDCSIGSFSMVGQAEQAELDRWGDRRSEAPGTPLLPLALAETLGRTASTVLSSSETDPSADQGDSISLNGPELLAAVQRTAAWLQHSHGVERGDRVAIQMRRSVDAVIAILACWWAGASYVPIDPKHPALRRRSLIERAGCATVLTSLPKDEIAADTAPPYLPMSPESGDEAYLLFTSGSTGEPKGVPITHRGVADYLHFARSHYLDDNECPVVPLFSTLSFDLTVTSLFLPLISGGELIVIGADGGPGLRQIADEKRITWAKATPSHLELLVRMLDQDHQLNTLVIGGEALGSHLVDSLRLQNSEMRIFNEYGPTEAVVGCMIHQAKPAEKWSDVPIGIPSPGTQLLVVDRYDSPVPVGSPGELLISHRGITSGYLGTETGSGSFVEIEGNRFYRSGDLVRFVAPAVLTYLGRIDTQVKVGGIRLDPTEVEHQLQLHPAVERAVVRMHFPAVGADFLTAWFKATTDSDPSPADLRKWLTDRVPSHAVPTAYVHLSHLPTTNNGKLDTASLPAPTVEHRPSAQALGEPLSDLEQAIVAVWTSTLGIGSIGPDDVFFDLGGDSLAAMQSVLAVAHRIGRAIPEELIFENRSPRELALAITALEETVDQRSNDTSDEMGSEVTALPLTPSESAMVYEWLNDPDDPANNVGRAYRVHGLVDTERLRQAAELLISRHLPLRLTLIEPRRHLMPSDALEFTALRAGTYAQFSEQANRAFNQPFDLQDGPLLRVLVQTLTDGGSGILLALHHSLVDESALDTLFGDLDQLYSDQPLAALSLDYPQWGRQQIRHANRSADRSFWLDPARIEEPAAIELRSIAPPTRSDHAPADRRDGYIERICDFKADHLDRVSGASRAAVALAALACALRPLADSDLIQVGMPISTRSPANPDLAGYSLNTLPVNVSTPPDASVDALAGWASAELSAVMVHRQYPFASIVRDRRSAGLPVPPLNILLAFANLRSADFNGSRTDHTVLAPTAATTDATFFVQVRDSNVSVGLEYAGTVLTDAQATILLERFEALLAGESPALLSTHSGTSTDILWREEPLSDPIIPQLLHELIAAQTVSDPSAIAVSSPGRIFTFGQLDSYANGVAHQLVSSGVTPGAFVGVVTARKAELVAGILGVLKAGCAYVPIDPDYPEARIKSIVADSAIDTVVAVGELPVSLHSLDLIDITDTNPSADPPALETSVTDFAYAIFTSGSTGRPKGVTVSHANISYSTMVRSQVYGSKPERFLLLSSFAFDSSMVGLWWTLCAGGQVVLPEAGLQTDVFHLSSLIADHRVTHLLAVPSLYSVLLSESEPDMLASLNTVIVAGEACPTNLISAHFAALPSAELHNEYGPTEATVWSHHHKFAPTHRAGQAVPIGKEIPGSISVILDADLASVPPGNTGELYVGGPGATAGYLGRPDLTNERFGQHVLAGHPEGAARLYRTGDLVRELDNGDLEFIGRADDQVKIRGYRVELGEIETALNTHYAIAVAAVRTYQTPNGDRLGAWFVPVVGHEVSSDDLRVHMSNLVPHHMVPNYFGQLTALPITPNGKVDRAALPNPTPVFRQISNGGSLDSQTLSPLEESIRSVWSEVLGSPAISRDDNYFDLGGDSILSIRIVAGLRRQNIRIKPRDLFDAPTIAGLAAMASVDAQEKRGLAERPVGEVGLLPMQQWFFDQNFEDPNHWNQSMMLRSTTPLDRVFLSEALREVVAHHDALRASFQKGPTGWVQTISAEASEAFVAEFRNLNPEAKRVVAESVEGSLSLKTGELVAAAIFRHRYAADELLLSVHHLVMDGVSWRPLLEDLSSAYSSIAAGEMVDLPDRTSSVADWVEAVDSASVDPYWDGLELPEPSTASYPEAEGRRLTTSLAAGSIDGLFDRLLAAIARTHQDVFGWDRLVATLEGHGRAEELADAVDLSRTIGWFTSLYPIDIAVQQGMERELAIARSARPNNGVGALAAIGPRLPRLVINYLGQTDRSVAGTDLLTPITGIEAAYSKANHRSHDLGIIAYVSGGEIHVSWDYVPAEHPTELIEQALRRFEEHFDPTATRMDLLNISDADLARIGQLLNS